ncbi:PDZ domain-containing protein [Candidatus Dependentiae bacterium]
MKQQFWILNSALLCLLIVVVFVIKGLWQNSPTLMVKTSIAEKEFDCTAVPKIPVSQIYGRRDIFSAQPSAEKATKRSLVGEIPQLNLPSNPRPPERRKPEFIDPLNISLNGIILAADEENSICVIADETEKEKTYRVADNVQDGTIIKISRQSIVILRANGQQETYFLHSSEPGFGEDAKTHPIFSQEEDLEFTVDPMRLSREITSLGQFIEDLGIIPMYHKGVCVGMKIATAEKDSLAEKMGLKYDDIIVSIDGTGIAEKSDREKAYEKVVKKSYGDSVNVDVKRNGEVVSISYTLQQPKTSLTSQTSPFEVTSQDKKSVEHKSSPRTPTLHKKQFSESKLRERLSRSREFKRRHSQQYDENIAAIRKRLLDNMKARTGRAQVR